MGAGEVGVWCSLLIIMQEACCQRAQAMEWHSYLKNTFKVDFRKRHGARKVLWSTCVFKRLVANMHLIAIHWLQLTT